MCGSNVMTRVVVVSGRGGEEDPGEKGGNEVPSPLVSTALQLLLLLSPTDLMSGKEPSSRPKVPRNVAR